MFNKLKQGENKISVIGLGYVGLPIALEFGRKFSVVGYDIDEERIHMLNAGIDEGNDIEPQAFENTNVVFTTDRKSVV